MAGFFTDAKGNQREPRCNGLFDLFLNLINANNFQLECVEQTNGHLFMQNMVVIKDELMICGAGFM
jgi:hypothetical protein